MSMGMRYTSSMFLVMLLILVLFFTEMAPIPASRSSSPSTQNLEVQTQLKLLNKPAVKSIKSSDGDIIDCIKLTHQPLFYHCLLKNHTIQMKPNFHPESIFGSSKVKQGSSRTITQLWHLNGSCPEGTIPPKCSTKKDDLLRASSIKAFGKKKHKTIPQPRSRIDIENFLFSRTLEGYRRGGHKLSFVLTVVSYQLKDKLKLSPSAFQFVLSIAFFPCTIKPIYRIFSDCFPIKGIKRIPYLVIAIVMPLVPWLLVEYTEVCYEDMD